MSGFLHGEMERLVTAGDLKGIRDLMAFIAQEKEKGIECDVELNGVNAEGESLLYVSILKGGESPEALEIREWLFEQLKDDPVLLSDDNDGMSLVLLAARSNLPHLALKIIKQHPDADWLRASKYGYTPLHCAARHPVSELLEYLLTKGDLEKRNEAGETPLHDALYGEEVDTIALFVNCDADLFSSSNSGNTFFSFLESLPEEKKLAVFRQIKNEKQLCILNYYRKKLAGIPQLTDEKRDEYDLLYSKLMAQRVTAPRSLQELILSKMPYEKDADFPVIYGLQEDVLRIVPDYRVRVMREGANVFGSPEKAATVEVDQEYKTSNEVLQEDRERVKALLAEVGRAIHHLQTGPDISPGWRHYLGVTFTVIGVTISLLAFVAFIIFAALPSASLAIIAAPFVTMFAVSGQVASFLAIISAIGVCAFGSLFGLIGHPIRKADLQNTGVKHESFRKMMDEVNEKITSKLQALPDSTDLIGGIEDFDKFVKSQSYSERVAMSTELYFFKGHLENLLKRINITRRPFSPVPEPIEKSPVHHPLPARIKSTPTAKSVVMSQCSPDTFFVSGKATSTPKAPDHPKIHTPAPSMKRGHTYA
jgi:hypothetical protein